jgi:murein DD-endopeptidase MepM/ murein hydrolase activator NlpD
MKKIQTLAAFLLAFALAAPAYAITIGMGAGVTAAAEASTSVGDVKISAAMQTRITTAKDRADQEITRRITALTDLNAKIQSSTKLTEEEKTSFSNNTNTQISTLNDLKTKIDADADITTLKSDIKSITDSYRIFMLVIPQGRITFAADRLNAAAEVESAFATKLSARIDADGAAGKDVSAEKKALADMQAKISDATTQNDAAVSLVSTLSPDNGDKTKMAANDQALKDAHAKIKLALQDEVAARADARAIVKGLTGNANVNASASSTAH